MEHLKSITHWADACGAVPLPWKNGDIKPVMLLFSRIMSDDIAHRIQSEDLVESNFSVSFDTMSEMAEKVLGIPMIASEVDFCVSKQHLKLSLLAVMVSIKNSVDVRPKRIKAIVAPKVDFIINDAHEVGIRLNCAACGENVLFIERLIIEKKVYHRRCFKCPLCKEILHWGSYRRVQKTNLFECLHHWPQLVLAESKSKEALKPKPVPPPKPKNLSSVQMNIAKEVNNKDILKMQGCQEKISNDSLQSDDAVSFNEIVCPTKDSEQESRLSDDILSSHEDKDVTEVIEKSSDPQSEPIPDDPSFAPKAPPRPKRRSVLMSSLERKENLKDGLPKGSPSLRMDSKRRDGEQVVVEVYKRAGNNNELEHQTKQEADCYPEDLNPFDSEDGEETSDDSDSYDESLNPFGDDVEVSPSESVSPDLRRSTVDSKQTAVRTSVRPKIQPPPPPKPPRPSLEFSTTGVELNTLSRSRKNYPAPLPPVPTRRKIIFNDESSLVSDEVTLESLLETIRKMDDDLSTCESKGASTEKELIVMIEHKEDDWIKSEELNSWIYFMEKRCEMLRLQCAYVRILLERQLNEMHSETEYQIRCLDEKPASEVEGNRLSGLMELLTDIVDRKNNIVESKVDSSSVIGLQTPERNVENSGRKHRRTGLQKLQRKVKKYREKL